MRFRGPLLGLTILGVGIVVLSLFAATMMSRRSPVATASLVGGPFRLIDQAGNTVTDGDLKGQPFVVFFGFTNCPDICPTTLFELSEVFNRLGPQAEKFTALFVTVDPERDTPQALGRYLSSFNPRIRGLSGDQTAVDGMVKAYRAYAKKVPLDGGSYTMDHTAVLYLMDASGGFVRPLNMARPPEQIADELRALL